MDDKEPYFSARCVIRHGSSDDWYAERVVPVDVDGWRLDPMDLRCDQHLSRPRDFSLPASLLSCLHYSLR